MIASVTLLLLAVLATVRLTRLITTDIILETPRGWVQVHAPEKVAYLVGCDWCASVYVGAGVAGAWAAIGDTLWFQAPALALSASYVTGWLASREGE